MWCPPLQVDLLSPEHSLPLQHLRDRFLQLFPFEEVFCVSARHGAGVQELKQYLLKRCSSLSILGPLSSFEQHLLSCLPTGNPLCLPVSLDGLNVLLHKCITLWRLAGVSQASG